MSGGVRRAIGIIRVSERKGREGDSFASPEDQRDRLRSACERDGLQLVDTRDEIDVSGGTALAARRGLREAVEAVEAGEADVVMVAYFDRLVRSLRVQDEVVTRVEKAGGRVVALDFGQVTGDTAAQWLSGTMIGAVSEYYRRSIKERSGEAQARAIARGVAPWPKIPPGYARGVGGVLERDPVTAGVVEDAFRLRGERAATVAEVRDHLARHGIARSYHGTQAMLRSRVYLGEIHFGTYQPNLAAHEPLIDRHLWDTVQGVSVPRGPRPKSQRLLARLGVLRCGTCDSRMVVGTVRNGQYWMYRCPPVGDCPRRVTIAAELAEQVVEDAARHVLADEKGSASVEGDARTAEADLERAQADLDAAIRAFAGLDGEQAAVERLAQLRAARDEAQERAGHLGGRREAVVISAGADWHRLSLEARRELIRAVIDRATVAPGGRGAGRITVHLVGE
jgi:site-specific DNA recombinase